MQPGLGLKNEWQTIIRASGNVRRRAVARRLLAPGIMQKVRYEAIVDVEALPDFVPLVWFAEQFVCNRCDGIEAYILPSWASELTKGPRLLTVYKTGPREIGPTG